MTMSKAFFPAFLAKDPIIVVALLPIAIFSIMMDMKSVKDYAVLKLEGGEIIVPTKPRIRRIISYSLLADFLMLGILTQFLSGYDSVILGNSVVFYGLYLFEMSGAKGAIEIFRSETEKPQELFVEK